MDWLQRVIAALHEAIQQTTRSYIQPEDPVFFYLEKGLGMPWGQVEEMYMLLTRVKGTALVVWNLNSTGRADVSQVDYTLDTTGGVYRRELDIVMAVSYSLMPLHRYYRAFVGYLDHMILYNRLNLRITSFLWDIGSYEYIIANSIMPSQYLFLIAS